MNKRIAFFICILACFSSNAQTIKSWHGKKAAVVLTYDDAIQQQLDNAVPVLDSLKLKATFYLTANNTKDRLNDWKKVAANGHELGNHTLFHPCNGGTGREWVKPEYDLRKYSVKRMVDEVRMTNTFLTSLDGKTKRTFAFTCADMKIGDTSFIDFMKNDFVAARAVRHEVHTIDKIDLYNVDCYSANNVTAEQMMEWVKKAAENNSLLVVLFHGVGGGNPLNVSVIEHNKFLYQLKAMENDLWITTMLNAAEHIKQYQTTK